jgi:hypothetical protein
MDATEPVTASSEQSDLGKKSHWDNEFARDLAIFRETGDPGYAWFEEQLGSRLVSFFDESSLLPADTRVEPLLDVGCGNGQMLKDLHDLGYSRLFGVDYSDPAVSCAKSFWLATREVVTLTFAWVTSRRCHTTITSLRLCMIRAHMMRGDSATIHTSRTWLKCIACCDVEACLCCLASTGPLRRCVNCSHPRGCSNGAPH